VRWQGGGDTEARKKMWGQHRWKLRWNKWWEMRRGEAIGGIVSGGKVWGNEMGVRDVMDRGDRGDIWSGV